MLKTDKVKRIRQIIVTRDGWALRGKGGIFAVLPYNAASGVELYIKRREKARAKGLNETCPLCEEKAYHTGKAKVEDRIWACTTCRCVVPVDWVFREMSQEAAQEMMLKWNAPPPPKRLKAGTSQAPTTAHPKIDELLAKLKAATDPGTKRKLRVQLRKMGHRGGARS